MSEIIRCTTCNGRKRTPGIGGMKKECYDCKGIGFVTRKDVVELEAAPCHIDDDYKMPRGKKVKVMKKRGRKPKPCLTPVLQVQNG